MKTIYTLLVLSIFLMISLLIGAFIYFEKTAHENFYYIVNLNGTDKGDMEIDKYVTEKNIIYKSKVNMPCEIGLNKKDIRLELERRNRQMKVYEEIDSNGGIKELIYLKRNDNSLDFLAIAKSKFAYLDNIKIKKNTLFFDHRILVTLIPFIKLYNFRIGGSQSFNAIKYDIKLLPPSRYTVTLTSIRDEYINVDNKKVKTECLVLKAKDMDQVFIWVDKKGHNITALEIPEKQLYIKRTEIRKNFLAKSPFSKDPSCISQKISFTVKELELNGVLTRPKNKGIYPAIILFQGEDAIDKDNYGTFIDISRNLAKSGYIVLRFDVFCEGERLTFKSISIEDELQTIEAAISLLESFRFVDPEKIGIIAHSDANYILPSFLKNETRLKAWIMLSPRRLAPIVDTDMEFIKAILKKVSESDQNYEKDISRCKQITLKMAEESTKMSKNIMGKKVYLERMRTILRLNPFDDMGKISIPILALYGRKDDLYSVKYLQDLKKYIKGRGGKNRTLFFFRRLNHYLGDIVKTDLIKNHYTVDKEVIKAMVSWLDKKLKYTPSESAKSNLTK